MIGSVQMAIDYDLEIATPLPAAQVARDLCEAALPLGLFDATVTPASFLAEGATSRLGTYVQVIEYQPQSWEPVVNDLGFTPSILVAFRMDKCADISAQQDDMAGLVTGLLDRITGDAVLH